MDQADGCERALKLLRGEQRSDLAREFELLRSLRHPGLVGVHDFGWSDDGPFFTMDVCEGSEPRESGLAPPDPRFYGALASVLRALQFLHSRRLVHGDLKPGNIRLRNVETGSPPAILLDFGLSHDVHDRRRGGTVEYMAPEVASDMASDHRADLYSLGVVVYEWIAGLLPFRGDPYEVLRAHAFDAPPPLLAVAPGTPPAVSRLVESLLAKDPRRRPDSANAVIERLNSDLGLSLAVEPGRVAPGSASRLPLVGREAEGQAIRRFLEELNAGSAEPVFLIAGPPGVGKSRLVEEARALGQMAGFHVSVTRAETPIAEWARALDGEPAGVMSGASAVARLLRLHPRPALFVADDAQLLDAAALEDLVSVARYLAADREGGGEWAGSALLLALRAAEGGIEESLCSADIACRRLDVLPLGSRGVDSYLREALGLTEISSRLAEGVLQQTGGLPALLVLAAERLTAHMTDEGAVGLADRVESGLSLPPDAAGALDERARKLGGTAKLVLAACGLVPSGLATDLVHDLCSRIRVGADSWDALRSLERDGWIVRSGVEVRAAGLAAQRVLRLMDAAEVAEIASALAVLCEKAGLSQAVVYSLDLVGIEEERARGAARALLASETGLGARERERLLEVACRRFDLTRDEEFHVSLSVALALAKMELGLSEQAGALLERLLDLPRLGSAVRSRLEVHLGRTCRMRGKLTEAAALYEEVLAGGELDAEMIAEAESDLAVVERRMGRLSDSIARSERLLATGAPELKKVRGRVLGNLGWAIGQGGDRLKSVDLFRMAAAEHRATGDAHEGVTADYNAGAGLLEIGLLRSAARMLESVGQESERLGIPRGRLFSTHGLATCAIMSGDLVIARELLRDATRLAGRLGEGQLRISAWTDEAWIQAEMADYDGALETLRQAEISVATGLDARFRAQIPLHRGETLARLGDKEGASSAFEEAVRFAAGEEAVWSRELRLWQRWGTAGSVAGDLRGEVEYFKVSHSGWWYALSKYLVADLALREGDAPGAISYLEMSGDPGEDDIGLSFGILRSRALLTRGRAFEQQASVERALQDYEEALALATRCSQRDEAWQAEARLGLLLLGRPNRGSAVVHLRSALATLTSTAGKLGTQTRGVFLRQADRAILLSRMAEALQ
jgi:tetratricopeptide (TPR) repeat protein